MKALILILLISTGLGENKITTCSDFRTGTFTDKSRIARIVRSEKKQTETYKTETVNIEYEFKVVWTSKCEYLLIMTKTNQPKKPFSIGDTCRVKINDTFEDRYSFEATYKNKTIKEELYRIR